MTFAPFMLILQLLFAGILFKLEGVGNIISYFTISRWSAEALGSTGNLNSLELTIQKQFPMVVHEAEAIYEQSPEHMFLCIGILVCFIVLFAAISAFFLKSVSKDSR